MFKKYIKYFMVLLLDGIVWLLGKTAYMFSCLLGWRFVIKIGRFTGDAVYHISRKMRKTIEQELILLLGKEFNNHEIKGITRKSFEDYYMRQIEMFFFGVLNKRRINKIVQAEGIKNLDIALSRGKGVILLLSHFGSFLLPLPFLGYMGYRVNQVTGKQIYSSFIAERIWVWRKRQAENLPVKFIQVGKFLRPIYVSLSNNEVVAIAFDGRDGSKWAVVDFFEKKVRFSTGPFEMARRTGATIIPTFITRSHDNNHRLILEPPFKLSEDDDLEKALINDTENFTKIFAGYIAKYPHHFGMVLYKTKRMQEAGADNSFFVET